MSDEHDKKDRFERQSRTTLPPIPREDDPPMARPAASRRESPPKETIAKIALRAPPPLPPPSEHEEVMRALASITAERAKLKQQLEDQLKEQQEAFEATMHQAMRSIVIEEVPHHVAASLPPPATKKLSDSWFAQLPAILMALSALIAQVAQSCQSKAEVSADVLAKITAVDTRLTAHMTVSDLQTAEHKTEKTELHNYQLAERCYLSPVLQRLSVKVDDPEGAPTCPAMEFYPRPLLGSRAPQIQPKATLPVPP